MIRCILATTIAVLISGCGVKEPRSEAKLMKEAADRIIKNCEVSPKVEVHISTFGSTFVVGCDSYPRTNLPPGMPQ